MRASDILEITQSNISEIAYNNNYLSLIELKEDILKAAKDFNMKIPLSFSDAEKIAKYLNKYYRY